MTGMRHADWNATVSTGDQLELALGGMPAGPDPSTRLDDSRQDQKCPRQGRFGTQTGDENASLSRIVASCVAVGAASFGGPLSVAERAPVDRAGPAPGDLGALVEAIRRGEDPLGDAIVALRSPVVRRRTGCFYTPPA